MDCKWTAVFPSPGNTESSLHSQRDLAMKVTHRSLLILLGFHLLIFSAFGTFSQAAENPTHRLKRVQRGRVDIIHSRNEPVPAPQILPKNISKTPEGCNVTLQCIASAEEKFVVSWKKENPPRTLAGGLGEYQLSHNGRDLHVSWRKGSNDSTFTCTVSSSSDQKETSVDMLKICTSDRGGLGQIIRWEFMLILLLPVVACLLVVTIIIVKKRKSRRKERDGATYVYPQVDWDREGCSVRPELPSCESPERGPVCCPIDNCYSRNHRRRWDYGMHWSFGDEGAPELCCCFGVRMRP
ncbi:uncharacterized protein LOC132591294 [Zootoca vivipara]|uniref:uncharacterized protein LOC132591294 n=1 Tax=Zootoca vivipara TaxID=8524 RepID=UPI00293BF815|nr:uncharacterized protein LOC132591294 [Zootoca vivipara]